MLQSIKNIFKNDNKNSAKKVRRAQLIGLNNGIIPNLFNVSAYKYVKQLTDSEIDIIMRDLTFTQANESRKAATEKKEIQIITKNEKLKTIIESFFNSDVISQVLDTHIFGFNVFEVNWEEREGLIIPSFVQRDYRDFILKEENKLYYNNDEIPECKAIYTLYKPRFNKPYGDAMLEKIYFPIKIKNASVEFWVRFLEKFGSPWTVGKVSSDAEMIADEIHNMLSGDAAVIDIEDDIQLIQPSSSSSNNSFNPIIDYCDKQITKAILGGNLTAEVKQGSFAAAQTHNDIREDLANTDAKILEGFMNRAISMFLEINNIKEGICATLYNESNPKIELASRDKTIYDMGYKPTKEYIESTYNITVEEYDATVSDFNKNAKIPNKTAFKSSLNASKPITKIDAGLEEMKIPQQNISLKLAKILEMCNTYEEAYDIIQKEYDAQEFDELEDELTNAIANSSILGVADAY
jgi:phage gp29-like protein